jgi:hypothetical protein
MLGTQILSGQPDTQQEKVMSTMPRFRNLVSLFNTRSSRTSKRSRRASSSFQCETLEDRRLMAADFGMMHTLISFDAPVTVNSTVVVAQQTDDDEDSSTTSKKDLKKDGYKCEVVSLGFVSCTKKDETEYWCSKDVCTEAPRTGDSSGRIDQNRIDIAFSEFLAPVERHAADVDGNGRIDSADVPRLAADLNGNGSVDFSDFLILAESFGQQVEEGEGGDMDSDGTVGFTDFLILADTFGESLG